MTNNTIVVVDSDFHILADDHEALAMLAPAHRAGKLKIAGVTVVTGNTWTHVSGEHARYALENLALGDSVPVHLGATQPLLHRQKDFVHRSRIYGAAFGGAWGRSTLLRDDIVSVKVPAPGPDSYHAANFIADLATMSDTPITILAIGPLTNIALALRLRSNIVENIERVITMGGAFHVPGNVTPSAEFNWWFDAEAAAIVLESGLAIDVIPLDATDSLTFDIDHYREWARIYGDHPFFTSFHQQKFEHIFKDNPDFKLPVWDAIAAACLLDPGLVTQEETLWVTVDYSQGPSYGRVVAYGDAEEFNLPRPERPKARVVLSVDGSRFWQLYETAIFGASVGAAR